MQKNYRPLRISLVNTQGQKVSLSSGPEAFARLDMPNQTLVNNKKTILLGLGPLIQANGLEHELPDIKGQEVYFLECPEIMNKVNDLGGQRNIPAHWHKLQLNQLWEQILNLLPCNVWWYKQNMQFAPDFWQEIWGKLQIYALRGTHIKNVSKTIFVAGHEQQLLFKEICSAFSELGYTVRQVQNNLRKLLSQEQPQLFFCINMQGLDREGADFALLKALDIPVISWFVDNPWHILSNLRLAWWRQVNLFVTDASFINDLKNYGASSVYHLPLAASQHMWQAQSNATSEVVNIAKTSQCVFVGRASFPQHAGFFAAAKVSPQILNEAMQILEQGGKPHFHWWQERIKTPLWPGHGVRNIGLGAENCACMQRTKWLRALLPTRLTIFGDSANWASLLPEAHEKVFQPALDYYTELANVYACAPCVLNVTSLLLPQGLTQRHFDVWAAGGFLLTDHGLGLDIFPKNLTAPIAIKHYQDLEKTVRNLDINFRQELSLAWQEHIKNFHTYTKRMSFVLDTIN